MKAWKNFAAEERLDAMRRALGLAAELEREKELAGAEWFGAIAANALASAIALDRKVARL